VVDYIVTNPANPPAFLDEGRFSPRGPFGFGGKLAAMKATSFVLAGILGLSLTAAACGGGGGTGDDTDTPDAPPGTADADPEGWQVLAEGSWTLPPGSTDSYYCIYATVPRDMYIKAFRPLIPDGTHHTVATYYTGASPADGIYPCDVGTNGQSMFYGSGVGSPDFVFPTGVGLHMTAGQRVLINLHLYNASEGELSGTSGTLFQEAEASEIQNVAEIVLAGPTLTLNIPEGESVQSGTCNVSAITDVPIQVFSLSQHMHRLGHHLRTLVTRGDDEFMLQDIDYEFESQTFQYVNPAVELRPGDRITTFCHYNNDTGGPVGFGESSDDEMCFSDLFYYPAQGAQFICTGL
jgi:hypothetical protein